MPQKKLEKNLEEGQKASTNRFISSDIRFNKVLKYNEQQRRTRTRTSPKIGSLTFAFMLFSLLIDPELLI